jgi:flavin reductase (DIM6/NTAB) family NADH-FMN oxidoreductase RutF
MVDPLTVVSDCDRDLFREVIGHFMTGVTVITTSLDGRKYGMSASAVSSLSLDPPMLLTCLNDHSPTQQAITQSRRFCVNILAEGQHQLAMHFGRPSENKFADVPTRQGLLGVPVLAQALAWLECQVTNDVVGGTHRVFLARVKQAEARDGSPLAYFRGQFGRLELAATARALVALREAVIARRVPLDDPLAVAQLADALDFPRSHIYQALLALEAEGLVVRAETGTFFTAPVNRAVSDEAFDARSAIEIGVAELTVGRATRVQVSTLRDLMEATEGLISDGRFTDVSAYVSANAALHEHMVSLVGSGALLDAYHRLSIPTLMVRLFGRYDRADDDLIDEHRALVEAYEVADLDRARAVIRAHSAHAKATNAAALEAAGGRL